MKWFFILLLLANVIYFGWELDRQTKMDITVASSIPAIPSHTQRLQFLSELDTPPSLREVDRDIETNAIATDAVSTASGSLGEYETTSVDNIADKLVDQLPEFTVAPQQETPGPGSCFSFGPIADEIQARGLRDWFTGHGGLANLRHKDEQGRQLFWVYLSPQESRREAMETIKGFREKNIRDFRLIVKGNLQHAISMGLFSSQASVNQRLGELKKKGYKPVVVPYSDGKRVYWIDARLPEDAAMLDKVFNDYPSRFSSLPVSCTEIAMGPDYS